MNPEHFLAALDERLEWLLEDYPIFGTKARAFTAWVLINVGGVDEEEAVDAIVDGPDDKGIDAIVVPEDGDRLLVVQTKLTKHTDRNLSRNAIVNTLNGIDWLVTGDLNEVGNILFRSKAEEFRSAYLSSFPSVDVLIVSTSKGPADDGTAEVIGFLERMNPQGEPIFVVDCIGIDHLSETFRRRLQSTTPNEIELELMDNPYEREIEGTLAVVGSVSAHQIAELVGTHGSHIFEANIRNYLGNVKINRAILSTASDSDQAKNFLFYNNGLTFVCDDLAFRSTRESKRIRLKNAQIVNGCQTATALHEASVRGTLQERAEVFVRVIQRPDPDFVTAVTRNTNSQNAVTASDLVGSDPIQLGLAEELQRRGYYYERRRGDFRSAFPTKEDRVATLGEDYAGRVIRLREAAQAYSAFFKQMPVIAKKNTSYLFIGTAERGRYNEVFDKDTTAERVILAVGLYERIKAGKRRIDEYRAVLGLDLAWLPQADMFLLGLFFRAHVDPDRIGDNEYTKDLTEYLFTNFEAMYVDLVTTVDGFIENRKARSDYSDAPTFFKSDSGYLDLAAAVAP